jgi:cell cycle serine/threonine-protein kinase CDC5/MSD2
MAESVLEPIDPNRANGKSEKEKKVKLSSLCLTPPQVIRTNAGRDFHRGSFLGEGGFARCFQVKDDSGQIFAAKTVAKESLKSGKTKAKLLTEIKIHKSLSHANIVRFIDCFEDDLNVYILLEMCENQSLMNMLKQRKRLSEPEARFYTVQVLGAARYMHQHRIIHRDLKLGNIFIDRQMNLKVGDFGLAAYLASDDERKMTICGTPNYIAPEVLYGKEKGHSYEVDIWSIGVILYAILFAKPPFQCKEVDDIYDRIKKNDYDFPESTKVSEAALDLIQQLLSPEPEERPTIDEIFCSKFFKGLFPSSIPEAALYHRPVFKALTKEASTRNFVNCQIAAGLRVDPVHHPQQTKPVTLQPIITKDDFQAAGPRAILPVSLSPASTKEKYKMILVNNNNNNNTRLTTNLNLKQLQQQKIKTSTIIKSAKKSSAMDIANPKEDPPITCTSTINRAIFSHTGKEMLSLWQGTDKTPSLFISKWVDFSHRYGLSYQLSDGNVGVLFRNNTVMLMTPDHSSFLSFDLNIKHNNWVGVFVDPATTDPGDAKKVKLLKMFDEYMREKLRMYELSSNRRNQFHLDVNPLFIVNYQRLKECVMFHMNNGTYQFNFTDHYKLVISRNGRQVDIIDSQGLRRTWAIDEAVVLSKRADAAGSLSDPAYGLIRRLQTCVKLIRLENN